LTFSEALLKKHADYGLNLILNLNAKSLVRNRVREYATMWTAVKRDWTVNYSATLKNRKNKATCPVAEFIVPDWGGKSTPA
jgi:hypothetical protein